MKTPEQRKAIFKQKEKALILEALWFLVSTQHPATAAKTIRELAEASNPDLKGPYGTEQLNRAGKEEATERLAEALKEARQL